VAGAKNDDLRPGTKATEITTTRFVIFVFFVIFVSARDAVARLTY
jgi:hypothetical protein